MVVGRALVRDLYSGPAAQRLMSQIAIMFAVAPAIAPVIGGWLHLWYEAYPLGLGAGASIMHSVSTDGGRSWQRTRRLESGPFGGLGSRLGDIPRPLADGGVLLPLEEDGREGPWLRLAATGHVVGQPRQLPSAQPSAAPAP